MCFCRGMFANSDEELPENDLLVTKSMITMLVIPCQILRLPVQLTKWDSDQA